jgi:hypothetical protein
VAARIGFTLAAVLVVTGAALCSLVAGLIVGGVAVAGLTALFTVEVS